MDHRPPILSEAVAMSSIAGWTTSATMAVALGSRVLLRRAFPPRARFISEESSLKFMATRSRLLLSVLVLVVLDAGSNSYHVYTAYAWNTYNPMGHRLASAFTFSLGLAVTILAISFRCAVVVVADDAWRHKFLFASRAICLAAWACHAAGAFQSAFQIKDLPPHIQFRERMYALWSTIVICLLPSLALAGSVYSIRVAVRSVHEKQQRKANNQRYKQANGSGSTLNQVLSRTVGSLQKTIASSKRSGTRTTSPTTLERATGVANSFLPDSHHNPTSQPDSQFAAGTGTGSLSVSFAATTAKLKPTASMGMREPSHASSGGCGGVGISTSQDHTHSRPSGSSPHTATLGAHVVGRVSYPLSRTFAWLNVLVLCLWTLACLVTTVPQIGPFRNNAILSLLLTLCVGVESSFERLMQYHNRKRARRRHARKQQEVEQLETHFVDDPSMSVVAGYSNTGIQAET